MHGAGAIVRPSGGAFGCGCIRNPALGVDLCGSGAGRPLVQVSNIHDHAAEEESPTSVHTHNTQSFPHVAMSKADGGGKMTSLVALGRASSG